MHAKRRDMGLSISSCPKFEKIAGLMDVPRMGYTAQEPYLNWYMEETDRLEEMAGMEGLHGLASKMWFGKVSFGTRQVPAGGGG